MPVEFMEKFSTQVCRDNPTWAFVFGDNAERWGFKGQAVIRSEPNAIGVRTKWAPKTYETSYFHDSQYDSIIKMIDEDFEGIFELLAAGCTVVFPEAGLGTGLAELPQRAPKVYEYLVDCMVKASNA